MYNLLTTNFSIRHFRGGGMSEQKGRKITFPKGSMLEDVTLRIKLILRLMGDGRVNIFLKALPVVSLIYLVFPDLLLGPIDDMAIIWLGAYLFVELCPPDVVQEHINALKNVVPGEWRDPTVTAIPRNDRMAGQVGNDLAGAGKEENESIVDVEFWDKKDD